MELRIETLAAHPELVPLVAGWHFGAWGHQDPGGTEASWAARLAERARPTGIPSYYVALQDAKAAGAVGLCESDMRTRPELRPWLTGLYVRPHLRRRGIGTRLVQQAMRVAREAGATTLHLHTADAQQLYSRLGWEAFDSQLYEGEHVTLMRVRLSI
jgi:GNAT superfamily N-acetyltransferase